MSFRTRLMIATAGAVAIVIVLASALAYVGVHSSLRGEIDTALRERAAVIEAIPFPPTAVGSLTGSLGNVPRPELGAAAGYVQLVSSDGSTRQLPGENLELPVSGKTLRVAAGQSDAFLADVRVGDTSVRVLTSPFRTGLALQIARPLDEVNAALHQLRLILIALSVSGVAIAALLGALIARTATAPVRRLSAATHRVVSTGDLSARVDVVGKDELSRLASDFNVMMASLEHSQEAQRQLVADASHELRTPLTSLRTNIEVLARADGFPTAEREALLDDLTTQIEELVLLIGGLINLARGSEQPADSEDIQLDALVAEAVMRSRRHAPEVSFVTDLDPTIVHGDPGGIDQAVSNLLDNAVKWSSQEGQVDVTLHEGELVVRDRGPGIADEDHPARVRSLLSCGRRARPTRLRARARYRASGRRGTWGYGRCPERAGWRR